MLVRWLSQKIEQRFWPKTGKWAINRGPLVCKTCNAAARQFRMPRSLREFWWGGWTCKACGRKLDKFGEPIADRPRHAERWGD
jgi:hypothetical protein